MSMLSKLSLVNGVMPMLAVVLFLLAGNAQAQAAGQGSPAALTNSSSNATDACAAAGIDSTYDLGLHIGGIFIIMAVSSLGVMSAIFLSTNKQFGRNLNILSAIQLLKYFGCGVVVSTAWIHLLADGYSQFLNPCLVGDALINYGANFPGWIALGAALIVQLAEYGAMSKKYAALEMKQNQLPKSAPSSDYENGVLGDKGEAVKQDFSETTNGSPVNDMTLQEAVGHFHEEVLTPREEAARNIGTILLEAGVIFHSVIIGLALAIATDEWHTLIVAIVFHQFFEGLALGTRIAETKYSVVTKYLGMAIWYPLTTPFGIALGIGLRYTYNPNSQTAIIVQGVLDSAAGGILMYNGYVELVAVEMNHNPRFHRYPAMWKFWIYAAFILGLASMSIVGLWA
ncbi:hypothetical protein BZG36_00270 [Bifiguratus adelaidae]|uniref:Uncharacterized protein n=1 Tax=Bifiguratus adelaidae TaxID=1938954 RepID=A0A261Y7R3_9FUNG|nr:hypothetical protein BZG36_00270 [Bifiguratus adelaidae]